jgi:hypothetical protein
MELATSLSWKDSLLVGTGFTSALATGISIWLIFKHLLHYNKPIIQKHIVRIIIMIPIYAVDSWLSLIWPHYALYFNVARDMYEAYVLFEFFKYLTDCVDGEESFSEKLEYVPQMKYTSPLCCFHIKPGRIFLHRCKQFILQYVYVKIGLTIATFILELLHVYDEGNFSYNRGYLWITIFYNVSIFLSLYFLVLFYEGSKEILAEFKPLAKFLCIKAVIFFAFWQSVAISIAVKFNFLVTARPGYSAHEVSAVVNNALICIEMFPIAVAFALTFSWDAFKDPARVPRPANPGMFVNVLKNFGQVANFRDIVIDTKASLAKEPARRIVTEDFFEISEEEQKARIILEGTLKKCGEDLAKIWKARHVALISQPAGIMYWTRNPWVTTGKGKAPKVRGFSPFRDVEQIVIKPKSKFNVVLNTTRVWRFRCSNDAERDFWVNRINQFLPKPNDKDVVGLDGQEDVAIPMIEEDDDDEDAFGMNSFPMSSPHTSSFSHPQGDDESSDSEDDMSPTATLSDTLDRAERSSRPSTPAKPAGVLNFLNRGVQRLSSAVSSVSAPAKPPRPNRSADPSTSSTDVDSLDGARSNVLDEHHVHHQSSDDEVSITF